MERLLDFFCECQPALDERCRTELADVIMEHGAMDLAAKKMDMKLRSGRLLTPDVFEAFCACLRGFYGFADVHYTCRFDEWLFSHEALPVLIEWGRRQNPIFNGFFDGATANLTGGTLDICLTHGGGDFLIKNQVDKQFSRLLAELFNIHATVTFSGVTEKNDSEVKDSPVFSAAQDALNEKRQAVAAAAARKDEQAARRAAPSVSLRPKDFKGSGPAPAGDAFLGKPFPVNPIPMRDVTGDTGNLIISGEIFETAVKETKDQKNLIISFKMTDYTSSCTVKTIQKNTDAAKEFIDKLKNGVCIAVRGSASYDIYDRDVVVRAFDIVPVKQEKRMDNAPVKRVELHLHTNMSQLDGITSVEKYLDRAAEWGHDAIALTDHGVVYAYPVAFHKLEKMKWPGKFIYGIEAYFINDTMPACFGESDKPIGGPYVIFDLETTGLDKRKEAITEIGAVRVENGEETARFSTFVNPGKPIPAEITKLTGITDADVANAPSVSEALHQFLEFCGDAVLVAHNANFDVGFVRAACEAEGLSYNPAYIDTVVLARNLYKDLPNFKLNTVADYLGFGDFNHHRAVDDSAVLAKIFREMLKTLEDEREVKVVAGINESLVGGMGLKKLKPFHQIILVKNQQGITNLYKLISESNLKYFANKRPRIPKSALTQYREGLLVGSACEAGELFSALVEGKPWSELMQIASFYDFLEIQPDCNNQFLIDTGKVADVEALHELNRTIIRLAKAQKKPVIATGDVHFLDPEDEIYRHIILAGQGFADADKKLPLFYRTTDEMLEEFAYLGEELAYEVVVTNTRAIADMIEPVRPVPKEYFPPVIPGSEDTLREITWKRAHEIYGEQLPELIETRVQKELDSIIGHGYAVLYIIAQKLVWKSLEDGYLVGSRGSVGASMVAFFAGITEVNALVPHYICPNCKNSEFHMDGVYEAGCDMPDKICPHCGTKYRKDGFDIPFEVFLGFSGDKEPDIDLNFSNEYQSTAHKYAEEVLGKEYVFRAGTIGVMGDKTAYGYVSKYMEERGKAVCKAEHQRLVNGCMNVRRTTGQHPGGLVVVPRGKQIHEICPVQHPADDPTSDIITTHFEYHAIDKNLLKLDMLGHLDPTSIKMLERLTGLNAREIPLDDPATLSLFVSNEALGIEPDDIIMTPGTIALPEFGTRFARQMLIDTKPHSIGELVRIAGLAHGTDVWLGNASDLIMSGQVTLKEAICNREDIMLPLIRMGMEPKIAFGIMESVRKGRGLKEEQEQAMRDAQVPEWFIGSCKKIKYMYTRAHAVAYLMMAFRIAWFKVHRPMEFYATFFSIRADGFDAATMIHGIDGVLDYYRSINADPKPAPKQKSQLPTLEACYEFYKRGFSFAPVDLYKSEAEEFVVEGNTLIPPFTSLGSLGKNAALDLVAARGNRRFESVEELMIEGNVSKSVIETLRQNHVLDGMPESAQISLF